jgi:hypothetical protein
VSLEDDEVNPFVYIPSENSLGVVLQLGAYGSMVQYSLGGIDHKVFMDNDDLVFFEDAIFEYKEELT